jgi:hypothetical protein
MRLKVITGSPETRHRPLPQVRRRIRGRSPPRRENSRRIGKHATPLLEGHQRSWRHLLAGKLRREGWSTSLHRPRVRTSGTGVLPIMRPPYRQLIDVGQTDRKRNSMLARPVSSGQLSLAGAKTGREAVKAVSGANCLQCHDEPVGAPERFWRGRGRKGSQRASWQGLDGQSRRTAISPRAAGSTPSGAAWATGDQKPCFKANPWLR